MKKRKKYRNIYKKGRKIKASHSFKKRERKVKKKKTQRQEREEEKSCYGTIEYSIKSVICKACKWHKDCGELSNFAKKTRRENGYRFDVR